MTIIVYKWAGGGRWGEASHHHHRLYHLCPSGTVAFTTGPLFLITDNCSGGGRGRRRGGRRGEGGGGGGGGPTGSSALVSRPAQPNRKTGRFLLSTIVESVNRPSVLISPVHSTQKINEIKEWKRKKTRTVNTRCCDQWSPFHQLDQATENRRINRWFSLRIFFKQTTQSMIRASCSVEGVKPNRLLESRLIFIHKHISILDKWIYLYMYILNKMIYTKIKTWKQIGDEEKKKK